MAPTLTLFLLEPYPEAEDYVIAFCYSIYFRALLDHERRERTRRTRKTGVPFALLRVMGAQSTDLGAD